MSWWEDGVCTIEDTTTPVIIGKIIKDYVGKSSRRLRKCRVLYEPVSQDLCSRCNIKANIIMNMLLPSSFVPMPGSFFNKEPESVPAVAQGTALDGLTTETENPHSPESPDTPNVTADPSPTRMTQQASGRQKQAAVSYSNESSFESDESDNDDSSSEDEPVVDDLNPNVKVDWVKGVQGTYTKLEYTGPITTESSSIHQKCGYANPDFFPDSPDPVDCFFKFMPPTFLDKGTC